MFKRQSVICAFLLLLAFAGLTGAQDRTYYVFVASEAADKIALVRFSSKGATLDREITTGIMPIDIARYFDMHDGVVEGQPLEGRHGFQFRPCRCFGIEGAAAPAKDHVANLRQADWKTCRRKKSELGPNRVVQRDRNIGVDGIAQH